MTRLVKGCCHVGRGIGIRNIEQTVKLDNENLTPRFCCMMYGEVSITVIETFLSNTSNQNVDSSSATHQKPPT